MIILHTVARAVRFALAVIEDTRSLRSQMRLRYSALRGE